MFLHQLFNSTREEEKQRRATKRLAEKMRHAEEKLRAEEERRVKHPEKYEKYERKNAERLERAKKRCEQIRQIFGASLGAFDPANLNSSSPCNAEARATATSASQSDSMMSTDQGVDVLHPTTETIRLLSTAIAGCMQPCNLINKILNEIIAFIPQPDSEVAGGASGEKAKADQQQQTEFPRQNSATNTSDVNTPVAAGHPSSAEIEALFKEAAKELEKMNEIVANSSKNSMQTSVSSLFSNLERSQSSSATGVTQIEQNVMAESTVSNATLIGEAARQTDETDARDLSPESDFKIVTPPKSMRSRESSIEVHDVNSMMSDDSRDWTMVDAAGNDQDDSLDGSVPPVNTEKSPEYLALINSVSSETQTFASLINKSGPPSAMTQEEVRTSIQNSIKSVGEMNEMVKNSVASAQQSLQNIEKPAEILQPVVVTPPVLVLRPNEEPKPSTTRKIEIQVEPAKPMSRAQEALIAFLKSQQQSSVAAPSAAQQAPVSIETRAVPVETAAVPVEKRAVLVPAPMPTPSAPPTGAVPKQSAVFQGGHLIHQLSATTQANLAASRSTNAPKVQKAVVVYDPNPKINTAVHTMLAMGFTNEGEKC